MSFRSYCIFFSFFFASLTPSFAQSVASDSTAVDSSARFFTYNGFLHSEDNKNDTSFAAFTEFNTDAMFPNLGIGNSGHARYPVWYEVDFLTPSLFKGFEPYLSNTGSTPYYKALRPYSSLTYISGAKKDQYFRLLHTRNFGEALNVQLSLTKRGAEGFYNHLRTNHTFFNFSTNFESRNKRYGFLAHYTIDRLNAQENGGYLDFEEIDNPEFSGTSAIDGGVNRVKNQRYFTRHHYRFGSSTLSYDKDSNTIKEFLPYFELAYSFQYNNNQKSYEDPAVDMLYYPAIFIDSTLTYDSLSQKEYHNKFSLALMNGKYAYLGLLARHHFMQHKQTVLADTSYNNYAIGAFFDHQFRGARLYTDLDYTVSGYNRDDIKGNLTFEKEWRNDSSGIRTRFELYYSLLTPDFFLTHYESNHYDWKNTFDQMETRGANAFVSWKGVGLHLSYTTTDNAVLFAGNATPFQYGKTLHVGASSLGKVLNWGNFYLTNRLASQTTSNATVLPLPLYVLQEGIHYQNFLFKNALFTRIGVQLFYYSEHKGYAYAPALNQFHLSNNDQQIGDYPYLDFFVDLKVKSMKIFIKWAHWNQGLSGSNYFRVPLYPYQQRSIQFGLNWTIMD